jgi:hypothetical protein
MSSTVAEEARQGVDAERLDDVARGLAKDNLERLRNRLDEALSEIVSDVTGRKDWPGDVDPLSSVRYDEALEGILRQLIANALYMPRMLSFDQAEAAARHLQSCAMHGPFLAGTWDDDWVAFRGSMDREGNLRLETMSPDGWHAHRIGQDGKPV